MSVLSGMDDALDRLAVPGGELLDRVDRLLAEAGAPVDHAIWPLLRRLCALPGEAVAGVVALRPDPLIAAGGTVRGLLSSYAAARADLTVEFEWQGAAGAALEAHRDALAAQLGVGPDTLPGRMAATAEYVEALAGWMTGTRMTLARTLAEVLGSAEAVAVVGATGPTRPAGASAHPALPTLSAQSAAAELGTRVLATVAAAYDQAEELLARWRPALTEVPYHPPADGPLPPDAIVRVGR